MTVKYHFFGKELIIDRELKNRAGLKDLLGQKGFKNAHVLFVNQIHGNQVVVIDAEDKIHGEQELPKADALVTNLKNTNIAIVTADCSPILFFDEQKKIIAAAHAGWRGAKAGVIANTVLEMKKLGAEKISAIVGPMISQESYEVSQEFLDDFLVDDKSNSVFFKKALAQGKYLFDLPSYVEKRLREVGVLEIKNDRLDTYKNDQTLFSFRRTTHLGEKDCGRNVSVICVE
jgi:YfiH family protein